MSNYRKTMTEALEEMYSLDESVIDKVKEIASKKAAKKIDGVMVDSFTASAISQIYDKVNDANKKKMEKLPIVKLANLAFKMMQKNEFVPEEVELDEASARADARRSMRTDPDMRQKFSKDISATDDDIKGASKNIMMQMRKAQSLGGNFAVEFGDKKKVKIPAKVAIAVQQKFNSMRKPADKEKFQSKVAKSYKDMLRALKEEVELDEAKYDLYHKDFSSAMQHAYKMAKKLHGITVDPKEIDDKVASGPRKPSSGKTNSYRLKGDKGAIQVQVANLDNKRYELNMYKEEVELDEAKYTRKLMKDKSVVDYVKSQQEKNRKKGNTPQDGAVYHGANWVDIAADAIGMNKMSLSKKKAFDWDSEYEAVAKKLGEEVEVDEQLAKIKGKTPADDGRRAAVEDDIERAKKKGDKKLVKKLKERILLDKINAKVQERKNG